MTDTNIDTIIKSIETFDTQRPIPETIILANQLCFSISCEIHGEWDQTFSPCVALMTSPTTTILSPELDRRPIEQEKLYEWQEIGKTETIRPLRTSVDAANFPCLFEFNVMLVVNLHPSETIREVKVDHCGYVIVPETANTSSEPLSLDKTDKNFWSRFIAIGKNTTSSKIDSSTSKIDSSTSNIQHQNSSSSDLQSSFDTRSFYPPRKLQFLLYHTSNMKVGGEFKYTQVGKSECYMDSILSSPDCKLLLPIEWSGNKMSNTAGDLEVVFHQIRQIYISSGGKYSHRSYVFHDQEECEVICHEKLLEIPFAFEVPTGVIKSSIESLKKQMSFVPGEIKKAKEALKKLPSLTGHEKSLVVLQLWDDPHALLRKRIQLLFSTYQFYKDLITESEKLEKFLQFVATNCHQQSFTATSTGHRRMRKATWQNEDELSAEAASFFHHNNDLNLKSDENSTTIPGPSRAVSSSSLIISKKDSIKYLKNGPGFQSLTGTLKRSTTWSTMRPFSSMEDSERRGITTGGRYKRSFLDTTTVGAFAAHALSFRQGGLTRLLHRLEKMNEKQEIAPTEANQRQLFYFRLHIQQRMEIAVTACIAAFASTINRYLHSHDILSRISQLGFFYQAESLLSTFHDEMGMLSDMTFAVHELSKVRFYLRLGELKPESNKIDQEESSKISGADTLKRTAAVALSVARSKLTLFKGSSSPISPQKNTSNLPVSSCSSPSSPFHHNKNPNSLSNSSNTNINRPSDDNKCLPITENEMIAGDFYELPVPRFSRLKVYVESVLHQEPKSQSRQTLPTVPIQNYSSLRYRISKKFLKKHESIDDVTIDQFTSESSISDEPRGNEGQSQPFIVTGRARARSKSLPDIFTGDNNRFNVKTQQSWPGLPEFRATIELPPEVWDKLPSFMKEGLPIKCVPVFFTQGVNEMQTIANTLRGSTQYQWKINIDSMKTIKQYYNSLAVAVSERRLKYPTTEHLRWICHDIQTLDQLVQLHHYEKNTDILMLACTVCRALGCGRSVSCKSAKDRTGMSTTWEQARQLRFEHGISRIEMANAMQVMRVEGVRRANAYKNTGSKHYAFNALQRSMLPEVFRAPLDVCGIGAEP